jgi:hypothetical protein
MENIVTNIDDDRISPYQRECNAKQNHQAYLDVSQQDERDDKDRDHCQTQISP